MKNIIFALSLILTYQTVSAAEQQFIQCEATPTEYANNSFPSVKSQQIPIKIIMQETTMIMGEIVPTSFKVHGNYEVRISGYVQKPFSTWVKGETTLLFTADLLQNVPGQNRKRLLAKDVSSSESVSNQAQLSALKAGRLMTAHHLYNSDYLHASEDKAEIAKDMLVSVSVQCRLVR